MNSQCVFNHNIIYTYLVIATASVFGKGFKFLQKKKKTVMCHYYSLLIVPINSILEVWKNNKKKHGIERI